MFAGAVLLGFKMPRCAIALGLAALPLGGNRPGSPHAWYAIVGGAGLALGLFLDAVRMKLAQSTHQLGPSSQDRSILARLKDADNSPHRYRHPLISASLIYCFFSGVSLIAVPLNHLIDDLRNGLNTQSISSIAFSVLALLRTDEHALVYTPISFFLTILACDLSFHAYRWCFVGGKKTAPLFIGAIGVGLVYSLIVGLLDFYGAFDLRFFRSLARSLARSSSESG